MNNVFGNVWERIKQLSHENKTKRLYRKELFKLLTISEVEKIYTSYVSKDLYETKTDVRTQKKTKQRISFFKLKFNIRMKVTNEQIIYCVPRLKDEVLEQ